MTFVRLVLAGAGEELDNSHIRELHRATGGNPFFVRQLLRRAIRAATPPSIRDVLVEILAELSPATREVLDAAAVFGVEFDPGLLPEMSGQSAATVRAAITEAADAEVAHLARDATDLCAFTHGLFQRVLVESLAPARRALIHERIATTLEQGARTDLRWAAMLAAHCQLAIEVVGVERMAAASWPPPRPPRWCWRSRWQPMSSPPGSCCCRTSRSPSVLLSCLRSEGRRQCSARPDVPSQLPRRCGGGPRVRPG